MSKEKFTPGDWFVDANYNPGEILIRTAIPDDNGSKSEYLDLCSFACDETDNARANANLIAAAPDMYTALQKIAAYTGFEYYPLNKYAAEALLKAEGK